ncbi:MAG: hypothetical protein ACTSWR_11555 [Candidatus Helarchaeota archaeon]
MDFTGNIPKQSLRVAPSKYLKGQISGFFEIGDHRHAAVDSFYAYKYLPILKMDTDLEDGIVLLKGTIVSLAPASDVASGYMPGSDNVYPIFEDSNGNIVTTPIDNTYFGYERGIKGALVPANGGDTVTYTYREIDQGRTFKNARSYAQAGDTITIPANCPIGIVYHHVYQDIRGMWLNYGVQGFVGILLKNEVQIPFVNLAGDYGEAFIKETDIGYQAVKDHYVFLRIDVGNQSPGMYVMPDLYGKYIIQPGANATVQTVGRLLTLDIRWPQGGLEYVRTFPESEMPGDQTGGISYELYDFVKRAMTIVDGSVPSKSDIIDSIQAGNFGVANIEITI